MKVNDLEDEIMSVWATADDIDTLLYRYLDSPAEPLSEDDISSTLLGIKALHDQRCQRLWDAFEKVLANSVMPEMSGFDSNGIRFESDPLLYESDEQRRLDSMGLEGLRSGQGAQLSGSEQRTSNPQVAGSTPAALTIVLIVLHFLVLLDIYSIGE